jgi:hypothetical protein
MKIAKEMTILYSARPDYYENINKNKNTFSFHPEDCKQLKVNFLHRTLWLIFNQKIVTSLSCELALMRPFY